MTATSTEAPVEALAVCPSSVTFGATIQCSISAAGEVDDYGLNGATGERIRVRAVKTSGTTTPFIEIVRPNGTSLCGTVTGHW
jgi:hypothetical protein